MPDGIALLLAASGTALATGLGAVPVFFLGNRAVRLTPLLLGFAAGVMGVASIAGLLIPAADEGSALAVVGGLAVGVGLVAIARRRLNPQATFMGRSGAGRAYLGPGLPRALRPQPPRGVRNWHGLRL
jgi:zinc transporter ZupT